MIQGSDTIQEIIVQRFIQKYGRLPTEFDRDYLEMLRMTKYRILDAPDFKPAKCANCGTSKRDGRQYIDFGLEVDWFGIVYICGLCLEDITKAMGLFNKYIGEIERLRTEVIGVRQQVATGSKLNDDFLRTFREVQNYFTNLPAAGDDIESNSSDILDVESSAANEQRLDEIKSAADAAKRRPAKSTSGSGSKNVPSLADLLNASNG